MPSNSFKSAAQTYPAPCRGMFMLTHSSALLTVPAACQSLIALRSGQSVVAKLLHVP